MGFDFVQIVTGSYCSRIAMDSLVETSILQVEILIFFLVPFPSEYEPTLVQFLPHFWQSLSLCLLQPVYHSVRLYEIKKIIRMYNWDHSFDGNVVNLLTTSFVPLLDGSLSTVLIKMVGRWMRAYATINNQM